MAFLKANVVMVMAIVLLIFSSGATALFNNGPELPNLSLGRRVLSVSKKLPDHQPDSSGKGLDSHKLPKTTQYGRSPYGRSPYGRSPYRRSPYGRSPYGRSPYGRSPYRRSPSGPPALPTYEIFSPPPPNP